jgi:acyl carrier protein
MLDRDEFTSAFADFIAGIDAERSIPTVRPGDNLFDAGVLDSFTVMRVIVFLENLVDRPVDLQDANIESFATIDDIYKNFVAK